ncbi:MAG TPA: HipA N-terminal domain-containing protein [Candidatus Rifleibacterium sp.]|nr:HipA N-terminal domain-containing protein [Candidatus Rifleibacterium sp.]HPT47038.1 HipA N-terminal domain-containing protein [Candidatus Rifleibacterium sp.]
MAKIQGEQIRVWLDDPSFGPLQKIGTLTRGDRGSVRFAYEPAWLKMAHAFPLDPELDLTAGEFYPGNANFGVFMDSCPDRWGQVLMKRREAVEAREQVRPPRTLGAWEFLLGVQDCTRMGALRFSRPDEESFLADEARSAPPVARIAELQAVALDLHDRQPNMAVVIATAEYYRLGMNQAKDIINRIGKVICGWKARVRSLGLSAYEISEAEHLFQPATCT